MDPIIETKDLGFAYRSGGQSLTILKDINLKINAGELVALQGPSGSGKSTLFYLLGGLLKQTSGKITITGRDLNTLSSNSLAVFRSVNIGFVFQQFHLLPRASVLENILLPMRYTDVPRPPIKARALQLAQELGLGDRLSHQPNHLSGGQQQRVALARSLAKKPQLLLLDEPLGALDKKLRERTQFELVNILESVGVTCVMVTHDQEEAMAMATRIAVMSRGRVLQVGTPKEIYEYPNCRFVADFIGNVNLWEGTLALDAADRCEVKTAHGVVRVGHGVSGTLNMPCAVAIRPEKISLSKIRPAGSSNLFAGTVTEIAYFGSYNTFMVEVPGGATVKILQANTSRYDRGDSGDITRNDPVFFWFDETAPVVLTQ